MIEIRPETSQHARYIPEYKHRELLQRWTNPIFKVNTASRTLGLRSFIRCHAEQTFPKTKLSPVLLSRAEFDLLFGETEEEVLSQSWPWH